MRRSTENNGSAHSSSDGRDLLTIHLAEYDALMERCTNFISLHVGMWGLIIAVGAFFWQQWSTTRDATFVWLGGASSQALLQIWVTLIEEQYIAIAYIQTELRNEIGRALPEVSRGAFWRYEEFVNRHRIKESWWGEWILPALLFVAIAAAIIWRRNSLVSELPLVIVNLALLVTLAVRTHWRVKMRRTFSKTVARIQTPE